LQIQRISRPPISGEPLAAMQSEHFLPIPSTTSTTPSARLSETCGPFGLPRG